MTSPERVAGATGETAALRFPSLMSIRASYSPHGVAEPVTRSKVTAAGGIGAGDAAAEGVEED